MVDDSDSTYLKKGGEQSHSLKKALRRRVGVFFYKIFPACL